MTTPFSVLRKKMSKKSQAAAAAKTEIMLKEMMVLKELRQAMHLSQKKLAATLSVDQANVSQIESRTDMFISTLRSYINAMGGELDIIARFPEGEVRIMQFEDLGGKGRKSAGR
jgi:transcriptional regulator with XRE-family HTH domain